MIDDRERRLVVRVLIIGAVVMVAFWTTWYTARGVVESDTTQAYYDFENAFPLADAWVTACLLLGAVALRRRAPTALLWLLAGGGAGLFLFAIDVLYDIEHGIWWKSGGGVIEALINAVTLAFSVGLMRWAWRRRDALLAGS